MIGGWLAIEQFSRTAYKSGEGCLTIHFPLPGSAPTIIRSYNNIIIAVYIEISALSVITFAFSGRNSKGFSSSISEAGLHRLSHFCRSWSRYLWVCWRYSESYFYSERLHFILWYPYICQVENTLPMQLLTKGMWSYWACSFMRATVEWMTEIIWEPHLHTKVLTCDNFIDGLYPLIYFLSLSYNIHIHTLISCW